MNFVSVALTFVLFYAFIISGHTIDIAVESSGSSGTTTVSTISSKISTSIHGPNITFASKTNSNTKTTVAPAPKSSMSTQEDTKHSSISTSGAPMPSTKTTHIRNHSMTTVKPTDIPVPPTAPSPKKVKWTYKSGGKVCIMIEMAAQITVNYTNIAGKAVMSYINVPKNAIVSTTDSTCGSQGDDSQVIKLVFGIDSLRFTFSQNKSKTYVSEIVAEYFVDSKQFPGSPLINESITATSNIPNFVTSNKRSLKCIASQNLLLNDSNHQKTNLMIKDLTVEAFRKTSSDTFSEIEVCELDHKVSTPVIVPIVVGCILGGMLLIVFIAFIVGKKRFSANRPYEDL